MCLNKKQNKVSIAVTVVILIFAAFCEKGVIITGIAHETLVAILVHTEAGLADTHVPADVEDQIGLLAQADDAILLLKDL